MLADGVVCECDRRAEELGKAECDGAEGVFFLWLTFWSSKVGAKNQLGAALDEVFDGWERAFDACFIGDLALVVERDVEIDTHEDFFAVNVEVGDG